MREILAFLFVWNLVNVNSQENVSYLMVEEQKAHWYMGLDAGTTSWGGFVISSDVQATVKGHLFVGYFMKSWVNTSFELTAGTLVGDPGFTANSNYSSMQFGLGYGRFVEKGRFHLSGYIAPTMLMLETRNVFTAFGSVSPSFMVGSQLNIGASLYGTVTQAVPAVGYLFRFRYLMSNRRTFIMKDQREQLK